MAIHKYAMSDYVQVYHVSLCLINGIYVSIFATHCANACHNGLISHVVSFIEWSEKHGSNTEAKNINRLRYHFEVVS